jgi:hypothetical protein
MPIRSVFAYDDPLTRALGRPSRDQAVTRRESITTTLQALELTNGATLDAMLRKGAVRWHERFGDDDGSLVEALYLAALGRPVTAAERQVAIETAGHPPTREGIEDLLWAVTMLPEFQLY